MLLNVVTDEEEVPNLSKAKLVWIGIGAIFGVQKIEPYEAALTFNFLNMLRLDIPNPNLSL
jgi:hypothetical protein